MTEALNTRIAALEAQLRVKDDLIVDLRNALTGVELRLDNAAALLTRCLYALPPSNMNEAGCTRLKHELRSFMLGQDTIEAATLQHSVQPWLP